MTSTDHLKSNNPIVSSIEKPNSFLPHCRFCSSKGLTIVIENDTVFAIKDNAPVSRDHLLIIPRRHCMDYFEMTCQERCDAHELMERLKERLLEKDPTISGFNIGVNCGETAGQSVFHTHIHLIPRRKNDTPNPRGGVRGVIPGKMDY